MQEKKSSEDETTCTLTNHAMQHIFEVDLFQVYDKDKKREVGKISKQWSGLIKEMFTDADNFGVSCKYSL